jgi:hypothetical protein
MEKRKFHMAILAFIFVLAAAPLVWSEEANKPVSKQPASADTGIMAHYEMMGHTEEALNASRQNDLQGATKHAQMALKAGESVQGVLDRAKVDPEKQKEINEGIQSLKEGLKLAQSRDSKGFENSIATAMSKFSPEKDCTDGDHGAGCAKAACGCAPAQMSPCDPFHPTRKCTTVGCNCYCM